MSNSITEEEWLLFEQDGLRTLNECENYISSLEDGSGDVSENLNGLYRALHSIKGNARVMELSHLEGLAHAAEDLVGLCRDGISAFEGVVMELVLETSDLLGCLLPEVISQRADVNPRRVMSIIERIGLLVACFAPHRVSSSDPDGEIFESSEPVDFDFQFLTDEYDDPPIQSEEIPSPGEQKSSIKEGSSHSDTLLHIRSSKIQEILSIASDLGLSTDALLAHGEMLSLRQRSEEITELAHRLTRLMRDLRFSAAGLALVPVNELFVKIRRISRELARTTGKQFQMVFAGEDTEIDKSLVDALADPVLHIIRNAVDHGLESSEERDITGKAQKGRLSVDASYSGNEVLLTFTDDGKGLDTEAIERKAIERGVISADHNLSEGGVHRLIFHPGLSTKSAISELSGRGVGLDVVNQTIKDMRGRIDLSSKKGEGTTLRLFLPLTLAFADALIVEIGAHLYAIPLESVARIFLPEDEHWLTNRADQSDYVQVKNAVVPVIWLGAPHAAQNSSKIRTPVVCVKNSNGEYGLPVTALRGTEQVTIRPLDRFARNHPAVAACGILSSGEVASTLNCEGLLSPELLGKTSTYVDSRKETRP